MQPQTTPAPIPVTRDGVCVVDGYGIELKVERGHLVVADGIGPHRRRSRFSRATSGIKRLVVLGRTGYWSLEAIRWLADVGVGFVQLDPDGRLLVGSAGLGLDDPRLRRAQALSWSSGPGMAAALDLLDLKLRGQAAVARRLPAGDAAVVAIEACRPLLRLATTPAELMAPEAAAASAYWAAWSGVELRWAKADLGRVPDHWRTFGSRSSPLTGNPRLAANPANALLSYGYRLLEAAARLSCITMGLDPGLGILHADQRARDSLALDVIEAARPDVDAFVLDQLRTRTFRVVDFHETRQGACRILSPLTHELVATLPAWEARLGPIVEGVARAFAASPETRTGRLPTLLTGDRRSAGRAGQRRAKRRSVRPVAVLLGSCRECGAGVPVGRDCCGACLPVVTADQRAKFLAAGQIELRRQRETGADRSHGGRAGRSRASKVSSSRRAAAKWQRSNGPLPDPEVFRRDVLPLLAGVPAAHLAEITGLSRPYCAAILRGERVPHARWWEIVRTAARATKPA